MDQRQQNCSSIPRLREFMRYLNILIPKKMLPQKNRKRKLCSGRSLLHGPFLLLVWLCCFSLIFSLPLLQCSHAGFQNSRVWSLEPLMIFLPDLWLPFKDKISQDLRKIGTPKDSNYNVLPIMRSYIIVLQAKIQQQGGLWKICW